MPAKYFCDKCGVEVTEFEYYSVNLMFDPKWQGNKRYLVNEALYLCQMDKDEIVFKVKKFLEDLFDTE